MATTQITFAALEKLPPAIYAVGATVENLTPSGVSSATTAAASVTHHVCRVSTDTAIYVAFGSAPTASSTAGFLMHANTVEYFRIKPGDKAAAITA